jgi:hypothetical protein
LVWKYRGKKTKLWKSLEKKYGSPVLQEDEWKDREDVEGEGAEEHEDLDDDSESSTSTEEETKEEQDL